MEMVVKTIWIYNFKRTNWASCALFQKEKATINYSGYAKSTLDIGLNDLYGFRLTQEEHGQKYEV